MIEDEMVTCYECNGLGKLKMCSYETFKECIETRSVDSYRNKCKKCVESLPKNKVRHLCCFVCLGSGVTSWINSLFREI